MSDLKSLYIAESDESMSPVKHLGPRGAEKWWAGPARTCRLKHDWACLHGPLHAASFLPDPGSRF